MIRMRRRSTRIALVCATAPGGRSIPRRRTELVSTREHIADRVGVYRSVAKRVELNNGLDVCARDRSPRESHTH